MRHPETLNLQIETSNLQNESRARLGGVAAYHPAWNAAAMLGLDLGFERLSLAMATVLVNRKEIVENPLAMRHHSKLVETRGRAGAASASVVPAALAGDGATKSGAGESVVPSSATLAFAKTSCVSPEAVITEYFFTQA